MATQLIVIQELFELPYFCKDIDARHAELARPVSGHPTIERLQKLAAELGVVIPVPIFERDGERSYNSLVMLDADGRNLGTYRKSHIPDFDGYQEAFYFAPGDTGLRVFATRYGRIGAAICWDQWFPEAARAMALQGAEILVYPTAIGSEPEDPELDSKAHWQSVMLGHAAANVMPVAASNRIGHEVGESCEITFYGGSFISNHHGQKVVEASSDRSEVVTASFDLDAIREARATWGVFRTRRPDLYSVLSEEPQEGATNSETAA